VAFCQASTPVRGKQEIILEGPILISPQNKAYDLVDVMKTIGDNYQATTAQVALAWVRQQPDVTSTIIGAKNIEQLQSNVGSTDLCLSGIDLLKIEEVSPLPKQYPGWMIENQDKESRN